MGKLGKIISVFLTALLLCGCGRQAAAAPHFRVVTQVRVTCRTPDSTLERRYTQPEKMQAVLNYLRLLEYDGLAKNDPEQLTGPACKITVQLSDGSHHIYCQRADRYLSRDFHPWELVESDQAQLLYPLLQEMASDV